MKDLDQVAERRRVSLGRALIYGSPFVAAALTISVHLALPDFPLTWPVMSVATIVNGHAAAAGSAAGALRPPNPLALRVAHAASAAIVSTVVYLILLVIASSPLT